MIQSRHVAILVIRNDTAAIIALNNVAVERLGAQPGDELSAVLPTVDIERLQRRVGRGRLFTQFIENMEGVPSSELVAYQSEDGHSQLELIPAEGVAELRAMANRYVNRLEQHTKRIEKLSNALKQFPEQSPSPILRTTVDGTVQYANPAAEALQCVQEDEQLNLTLHPALRAQLVAAEASVFLFEVAEHSFEVHAVWSDLLNAYTVYVKDVTAERLLARTNKEIEQFPQSNPNPVLRFSHDGVLLYCNPSGQDTIDWDLSIGDPIPDDLLLQFKGRDTATFEVEIGSTWYSITTIWSALLNSYLAYFTNITPAIQNRIILENLALYFSPEVVQNIVSKGGHISVETQRKKLTVFFSDIVGFSSLTADLEPEVVTQMLYEYLTEMTRIADRWGATVDKYIGDALMVFFGDPVSQGVQKDAARCVLMALEMRSALGAIQAAWRTMGIMKVLRIRTGIHTGVCTVGNFGSQTRLDYTAIGNGVNVAARLESIARPDTILCSEQTAMLVQDVCSLRRVGEVTLKNIPTPYVTYEVRPKEESTTSIYVEEPGMSVRLDLSSVGKERVAELLANILSEIEE